GRAAPCTRRGSPAPLGARRRPRCSPGCRWRPCPRAARTGSPPRCPASRPRPPRGPPRRGRDGSSREARRSRGGRHGRARRRGDRSAGPGRGASHERATGAARSGEASAAFPQETASLFILVVAPEELVGAFLLAERTAEAAHGAVVTDPLEADGALVEAYVLVAHLAGKAFH